MRATEEHDIFLFLLGYRWLSLLPVGLALWLVPAPVGNDALVLLIALADNLLLTVFHPRINRLVRQIPIVLGIDLLLVAIFISLTGGTASPYYLYALCPLLAAAFFFQLRGGVTTAFALTLFYTLVLTANSASIDLQRALTQIISFFLIAILFGYASILVERIRRDRTLLAQNNAMLERTNRELQSIHNLAVTMQSSAIDVADVQEIILTTITNDMGFERAMIATVDPERNVLTGWLTHRQREDTAPSNGLPHTSEVSLVPDAGTIAQNVLNRRPAFVVDGLPPTNDLSLNRRMNLKRYAILPLYMRDHPLGVLLVDNPESGAPITVESMHSLELVAEQAAIALGSTKLCIERAQRLAVEEERNRLAMEIHDTASQSLFGIVYTLDGCVKMLPDHPAEVQSKLKDLRTVASRTMNDLRRSVYDIWSGELTEAEFKTELITYLQKLGAPASLSVEIRVRGTLSGWGNIVRRNLLRIAEEGLANVVKHSGATHANVSLDLNVDAPRLIIEDNGHGFETRGETALRGGIGLANIRERARAIGGEAHIESNPSVGTRIEVRFPTCVPQFVESSVDANPLGR
jgi:signal transduction histidine kinase